MVTNADADQEHQWWARLFFACVSAVPAVATFHAWTAFLRMPEVAGSVLLSMLVFITTFFAVLAAPVRFQARYSRRLLIATLLVELVVNVFIILR